MSRYFASALFYLQRKPSIIWIFCIVILYGPQLEVKPYFDDVGHIVFASTHPDLLQAGPLFYRPIERFVIGLNWYLWEDHLLIAKSISLMIFLFLLNKNSVKEN